MSRYYGKIGRAPCGHLGEAVIGQYYQCLEGCESKRTQAPVAERCSGCGSTDIDDDFKIDPLYYVWNPDAKRINRRCWSCGSCWITS